MGKISADDLMNLIREGSIELRALSSDMMKTVIEKLPDDKLAYLVTKGYILPSELPARRKKAILSLLSDDQLEDLVEKKEIESYDLPEERKKAILDKLTLKGTPKTTESQSEEDPESEAPSAPTPASPPEPKAEKPVDLNNLSNDEITARLDKREVNFTDLAEDRRKAFLRDTAKETLKRLFSERKIPFGQLTNTERSIIVLNKVL
jgi:hypothetical protein